jgi:linoleoyl-CoA desaturase
VRAEVDAYFTRQGLSTKADAGMVLKTITILALTFVPYGLILSGWFSGPVMLLLAAVSGVGIAGVGFSIAHDALHGAYSDNPRVNRLLGLSMDLVGGSGYLWKITHNIIHHTYTNIHGTDEDLAVSPLLRLSPHADRRWYHRYQHVYALGLYCLTTMFWVFIKDFKYLLQRDLGPYTDRRHSVKDVATLLGWKVVYYGWSVVIPLVVIDRPWWQIVLGILVAHLVAGFALGIVFQLAHVIEETAHPEPDAAGAMPDSWGVHEMETTANFGPRSRLLRWYVGGLNYQIEHHLFPRVCSIHYPAISPIVQRLAAKHGLPYHSHETFVGAIGSHLRTLRRLGNPAEEPTT